MTSQFLASRRSMLAKRGTLMTLRRLVSTASRIDVGLLGFLGSYSPDQISGALRQGDARVAILDDEIQAAVWPGPPRAGDQLLFAGKVYVLQGCATLRDGALVIGHDLTVRG